MEATGGASAAQSSRSSASNGGRGAPLKEKPKSASTHRSNLPDAATCSQLQQIAHTDTQGARQLMSRTSLSAAPPRPLLPTETVCPSYSAASPGRCIAACPCGVGSTRWAHSRSGAGGEQRQARRRRCCQALRRATRESKCMHTRSEANAPASTRTRAKLGKGYAAAMAQAHDSPASSISWSTEKPRGPISSSSMLAACACARDALSGGGSKQVVLARTWLMKDTSWSVCATDAIADDARGTRARARGAASQRARGAEARRSSKAPWTSVALRMRVRAAQTTG